MASYASVANLPSLIFYPRGAKSPTENSLQALAFGGKTLQIRSNFDDAMELVVRFARACIIANSINPFRIEGQKAIGFEVLQQLDWQVRIGSSSPAANFGQQYPP